MQRKFVALIGIPRSGTTMTAAVFDVHPNVYCVFEPWNASKNHSLQPWTSCDDYINHVRKSHNVDCSSSPILFCKETTAHDGSIRWLKATIDNLKQEGIEVKLIWLIRDINHAYLSRVRAAREWWGHKDMQVEKKTFLNYIDFAFTGIRQIWDVLDPKDSIVVSYEYMLKNFAETIEYSMNFLGEALHPNQLEYHLHFNRQRAAGDLNVSKHPHAPTYETVEKKDKEWSEEMSIIEQLSGTLKLKYDFMCGLVETARQKGMFPCSELEDQVKWLDKY